MEQINKISPKKLRKLYWRQKMSSSEIAKIYHCDHGYIRKLLRKYKIRMRAKSEARKLFFKIVIPKKELKKLYREKKLSSPEIAEIYKCGPVTIRNRLREYGIQIRTRSEANRVRFNINISKKELKNLYEKRKMSSPEIAKILSCSPNTIRDLLRKYGLRIRTKSEAKRLHYNINIPRKELKRLYLEKKLSSPEIAQKFKVSAPVIRDRLREYKIPVRNHYEAHLLCNQPRYKRHDFNGNLKEKAYLIGFRLGDLHVFQAGPRTIISSMGSTKSTQINLFKNLFSKYGHIWQGKEKLANYNIIRICCYLNNTFRFLLDKKDLIESWILKNTGCFAAFLAGYSDAEGSFCIYNKTDGVFNIRSQDKNILHQIRDKLIELEIFCRPPQIARKKGTRDIRGTISNEDIWGLWVYRKDALLKLINLLNPYIKHADKRKNMEIVKNNVFERNKKYNNQQDRRFYKLYLEEGINIKI